MSLLGLNALDVAGLLLREKKDLSYAAIRFDKLISSGLNTYFLS
jgi:hypothetical protein